MHSQSDTSHKSPFALATLVLKMLRTDPTLQEMNRFGLLTTRVLNFQVFGIVVKSLVVFEIGRCLEQFITDATNSGFLVLMYLLHVSGQLCFPLERFSTLVALMVVCGF